MAERIAIWWQSGKPPDAVYLPPGARLRAVDREFPDIYEAVQVTTVQLDDFCREELTELSALLHQPADKIANAALREYLDRRTAEEDLSAALDDLRAYRKKDPEFRHAIAAFAAAEVSAKEDPAEGRAQAGPARTTVRDILNG